jgi:Holliday junction resolvasome RuvABC DNA-binding subunit
MTYLSDIPKTTEQMVADLKESFTNLSKEFYDFKAKVEGILDVKKEDALENTGFYYELTEIKGIGNETASDIISVFPSKESLIESISKGDKLPFRNDVTKKLKEKFI